MILLECLTESVFFGRYRSVFLGIYHTDNEGKLGSIFFGIKILAGAPQKIGGSPLFPKKGGPRPPLCTLRPPPFEEKKEFLRNFSKKEFPQNLKKVFPPNLTVQQYRPKNTYRYRLYISDTGKYRYRKNDWYHRGKYVTLDFSLLVATPHNPAKYISSLGSYVLTGYVGRFSVWFLSPARWFLSPARSMVTLYV
jgi:hypothetical protein